MFYDISTQVVITANPISGSGITPLYTFSTDNQFMNVLQAESIKNIYNIPSAQLAIGSNWIFVRMRSGDTCLTQPHAIDSVNIVRQSKGGLRDPDYPSVAIQAVPNPFFHNFTIKGLNPSKRYEAEIVNPQGQRIYRKSTENAHELKIQGIQNSPGLYYLKIYDKTKSRLLGVLLLVGGN